MGKTMDRFGEHWQGHQEKLYQRSWQVVAPNDVLLLAGDLSWAMKRGEAEADLGFLASLPGVKVAIKGNHDYWWASGRSLEFPGLLQPPAMIDDGILGIAGTRGWFVPSPGAEDEAAHLKILERERTRLVRSLEAIAHCTVKIAMTHYPPHPYLAELQAAQVNAVAYGHLHLGSPPEVEAQVHNGELIGDIPFYCVACDRLDFTPRPLWQPLLQTDALAPDAGNRQTSAGRG